MPTNLAIDDALIMEAVQLGHHKTKKDAVTIALSEYVKRRKQQEIITSFGNIEYESGYDHKEQRKHQ